jgi:DNA-binding SARP family transcriptional activator
MAGKGHYELNLEAVNVDADRFEAMATRGLAAFRQGERRRAADRLTIASAAYAGTFLADEPYADWALSERDRLHALAGQALRALTELSLDDGDLYTAWPVLNRLSSLEPFDIAIQKQMLAVLIARGHRSEAARRFDTFRHRYERAFHEAPNLDLADLAPAARELRRRVSR